MDTSDLIMKNIEMLEKMQKQELQILKNDFNLQIKEIEEKVNYIISLFEQSKKEPSQEEQLEAMEKIVRATGQDPELIKQSINQKTLNTSMPSIETIKNNIN
jgi:hypothetical protein